jgi:hypothetical protein
MKRLTDVGPRIGGTGIEAAQFTVSADDVLHEVQDVWKNDRSSEHLALVDEVREPTRVFLLSELVPRLLPFFLEQLQNSSAEFMEQIATHRRLEDDIAVFIEFTSTLRSHHQ